MPPSPPRVDSALLRELAEAERASARAQAVVTLRRPDPAQLPTPEQTEAAARRVIEHAATETGERPAALNVFRNLNAFAVEASAAFIRSVLTREEVQSARSNRAPESGRMPRPAR
ncbi:MAG TPA: hypothetical protein VNE71_12410 [Myxococcota bacterium]|nr:hypothetical protein [Myxococcota bacterium]